MSFDNLGLTEALIEGLSSMGITQPTPIQAQAIPVINGGDDLIGVAQTGTGKTAAFLLPVINRLSQRPQDGKIRALIVVPTRELAVQIDQACDAYAYFTDVSSWCVYGGGGGEDFAKEKRAIQVGVDILIATPGRLLSHIASGYVDFSKVEFLILDEADRMLDMGFKPDLDRIVREVNTDRQTLMFSATMPPGVEKLSREYTRDPKKISISVSKPAEKVTQVVYEVSDGLKNALAIKLIRERAGKTVLVFGSTKESVSRLHRDLGKQGVSAGMMSSVVEQKGREAVMSAFKSGQVKVLVATDVISRGIDVDGIDTVINFDAPNSPEDYVHRIGRTARAQKDGEAITLISPRDSQRLTRIEALLGKKIQRVDVPKDLVSNNNNTAKKKTNEYRR